MLFPRLITMLICSVTLHYNHSMFALSWLLLSWTHKHIINQSMTASSFLDHKQAFSERSLVWISKCLWLDVPIWCRLAIPSNSIHFVPNVDQWSQFTLRYVLESVFFHLGWNMNTVYSLALNIMSACVWTLGLGDI